MYVTTYFCSFLGPPWAVWADFSAIRRVLPSNLHQWMMVAPSANAPL
jgi:hypothetical protein